MGQDITTFEQLYARYSADVYRFSYWLCGNEDDAKDITSETFVRVWTSTTETQTETVKAYLFTIARNLHLQRVRNRKKFSPLTDEIPERQDDSIHPSEIRSELEQTWKVLETLPEIDRSVMIMKAQDDLSYHEIAQLTGLTVSAIKVKIFRIRQKLAGIRL